MKIDVSITGIATDTAQMSSESVWLAFAGRDVQVETWGAENASGEDYYEDGVPVHDDTALAVVDAMQGRVSAVRERYSVLWQERVQPMIEAIRAEALAELGGPFPVEVEDEDA